MGPLIEEQMSNIDSKQILISKEIDGRDVGIGFLGSEVNGLDSQEEIRGNLQTIFSKSYGREFESLNFIKQVHGTTICQGSHSGVEADGWLLRVGFDKGVFCILTADCVPVIVIARFGNRKNIVSALHCGWKGVYGGMLEKLANKLRKEGELKSVQFFLGHHIKKCCFEVGTEFEDYTREVLGGKDAFEEHTYNSIITKKSTNKCMVSLDNLLEFQAYKEFRDVAEVNFQRLGSCTYCCPGLFSFRLDADKAGRLVSFVFL